ARVREGGQHRGGVPRGADRRNDGRRTGRRIGHPAQAPLTAGRRLPILNRMVDYNETQLDLAFAALADPTRRAILARLARENGLPVTRIAEPFPLSLPGVMKHLDVLARAK